MLKRSVLFFALGLLPASVMAAPTACPQHFQAGEAPTLVNERLARKTRELCYSGFAVLHSGVTRTPLWSAEHLTRDRVDAAKALKRHNSFHAESRLPADERAELSDYARSGFDRGHMSPSDDMPDEVSQDESFSLTNMAPQDPRNNRVLWKSIEGAVRTLARREGELYIVTGPIFQGETLQQLKGRVLIPTGIFKAVYDPKRGEAGAYVAPNTESGSWETVSLSRLQQITGIDVFPSLPAAVKDTAMALPAPRLRKPRGSS